MKIKKKKQVNLPKLIEWAWENGIKKEKFQSINNEYVKVEIGINFVDTFSGDIYPYPDSLFEIEEEIEINENTVLDFVIINNENVINNHSSYSINSRLNSEFHCMFGTKFIYLQNEDGSIGELVWENGKMVE